MEGGKCPERGRQGPRFAGRVQAGPPPLLKKSRARMTHDNRPDPVAQAILELLQAHQGRTRAVTVRQLQQRLLASSRRIRRAIQQLVMTERMPIASSVHPPYGFYLITSESEARECLHQYASRLRELSRRARILNAVVKERFGIDVQQEFGFDAPAR